MRIVVLRIGQAVAVTVYAVAPLGGRIHLTFAGSPLSLDTAFFAEATRATARLSAVARRLTIVAYATTPFGNAPTPFSVATGLLSFGTNSNARCLTLLRSTVDALTVGVVRV